MQMRAGPRSVSLMHFKLSQETQKKTGQINDQPALFPEWN